MQCYVEECPTIQEIGYCLNCIFTSRKGLEVWGYVGRTSLYSVETVVKPGNKTQIKANDKKRVRVSTRHSPLWSVDIFSGADIIHYESSDLLTVITTHCAPRAYLSWLSGMSAVISSSRDIGHIMLVSGFELFYLAVTCFGGNVG